MEDLAPSPPERGVGRGSRFFVLSRSSWDQLWSAPTANRLNLATTFLVMLAGTGADHRFTKWSAKACEQHAGMGKPRAQRAIEELIAAGLAERTEAATRLSPQYRLPPVQRDEDAVFLPVQLVTGFSGEASLLRRTRETGDPLVLRMLVELYGSVQLDATYGLPLAMLRETPTETEGEARKVLEAGVNAMWALAEPEQRWASGGWLERYRSSPQDAKPFWERIAVLMRIGGLWFEPWVMDGPDLDAEPLFPVALDTDRRPDEAVERLTHALKAAAYALAGERGWIVDNNAGRVLVTLPVHHRPPAVRGIARLRIEPDSPGHRVAFARRMEALETQTQAYEALTAKVLSGRFDVPLGHARG